MKYKHKENKLKNKTVEAYKDLEIALSVNKTKKTKVAYIIALIQNKQTSNIMRAYFAGYLMGKWNLSVSIGEK